MIEEKVCPYIEKMARTNIVWVNEGCKIEERFKYSVVAGTFVSYEKCKECMKKSAFK